jgi:A nuclease family of the HNH/ENDO VII superfamily with conserved AHH
MIKAGVERGVDEDTHHIVPREAKRVDPARKILDRFGIDLDDPANGIFLPKARHDRLHGNRYYDAINRELANATTKSEAEQILQSIAQRLEEGTFP